MDPYLCVIVIILLARLGLEACADILNMRHLQDQLPSEFSDVFDSERYRKSQIYLRATTRFGLIEDVALTGLTLLFLLLGGFRWLDELARAFNQPPLLTGLLYIGILILASRILRLPFTIYETFGIEARFGFNRTTIRTFIMDMLKGLLLMVVLGAPLLGAILWFFEAAGTLAWLWAWLLLTAFQLVLMLLAPYVILPLFNHYVPLPDGDLRRAIEEYARSQSFAMKGIFTMDGSRRSAKSNAFFTGFGRGRRIVLFDTLVERHSVPELVSIVAHEMGHYKHHHIPAAVARSIFSSGLALCLLGHFIDSPGLAAAFGLAQPTAYTGLVFFGFLYTPLAMALALLENAISRRHEYQADAFAAQTSTGSAPLITALKRLSADNLSNLTPHPFKVFVSYTHPPLLARITALRRL